MEIKKKEVTTINAAMIITLAVVIPIILFPAAFVWYLNIGGVFQAMREARDARAKKAAAVAKTVN